MPKSIPREPAYAQNVLGIDIPLSICSRVLYDQDGTAAVFDQEGTAVGYCQEDEADKVEKFHFAHPQLRVVLTNDRRNREARDMRDLPHTCIPGVTFERYVLKPGVQRKPGDSAFYDLSEVEKQEYNSTYPLTNDYVVVIPRRADARFTARLQKIIPDKSPAVIAARSQYQEAQEKLRLAEKSKAEAVAKLDASFDAFSEGGSYTELLTKLQNARSKIDIFDQPSNRDLNNALAEQIHTKLLPQAQQEYDQVEALIRAAEDAHRERRSSDPEFAAATQALKDRADEAHREVQQAKARVDEAKRTLQTATELPWPRDLVRQELIDYLKSKSIPNPEALNFLNDMVNGVISGALEIYEIPDLEGVRDIELDTRGCPLDGVRDDLRIPVSLVRVERAFTQSGDSRKNFDGNTGEFAMFFEKRALGDELAKQTVEIETCMLGCKGRYGDGYAIALLSRNTWALLVQAWQIWRYRRAIGKSSPYDLLDSMSYEGVRMPSSPSQTAAEDSKEPS